MVFIRCPLWNNIRVDPVAEQLLNTPVVQRLRYVRQLGLVHLVYPGATHSRFEHALGAYHLSRRTLSYLRDEGGLEGIGPADLAVVTAAALLHDVGHYPFSHALEEIGVPNHEVAARPLLTGGEVGEVCRAEMARDAPERIYALVCGTSDSPLQGLISGSLDLDKMDYLKRDALMCGVPYGEIDEDRLMHALAVLRDPVTGRRRIGLRAKGLSALESLLFAKYQMYRNVYWHHAVRSATAMYKRLVEDALAAGALDAGALGGFTDEGLLHALDVEAGGGSRALLEALRLRRLYKRAFESPAAQLPMDELEWIADDRRRTRAAERALETTLGLRGGEVLLDFPAKTQMLGLDLPVLTKDGAVRPLPQEGLPGAINLPTLADQLYRSARYLRVFTVRRVEIGRAPLLDVLRAGA
ncbi:MAG TPA: HD domain-containing protein [Gemmatimonadaceae bacterium]|nr:HD domain-containing protein [Gemmatimonadaceae bacterium]